MRLFIAFPVSAEVVKELMRVQAELVNLNSNLPAVALAEAGAVIKWTEPQNFHVTAEFLGELNEADAVEVKKILKKVVSGHQPFRYRLDRIDAFPDLRRPSLPATPATYPSCFTRQGRRGGLAWRAGVLMVRATEESRESLNLRQEVHDELKKMNLIEDDKLWQPHITLGRVKGEFNSSIVGLDKKLNPVEWEVGEVYLIKSTLITHVSKYEILGKYLLK